MLGIQLSWADAPSCYLELLDKLHKWIWENASPSLATSLEPLAHRGNVANLGCCYSYYFGGCSFELAQVIPLCCFWGRWTCQFIILMDCMIYVTICRCYKCAYINSLFPCTAGLWNSLPIECVPLTYDLNAFKFRINRHLLTAAYF